MSKVLYLGIFTMLSLSGCSLLSPVEIVPPNKYLLDELPSNLPKKQACGGALFIQTPETRPIFNTTQMAYITQAHQISFFSYNEWAETPAQMLQALLVRTLQKTNAFNSVVTSQYVGLSDYTLATQIQELTQDFTQCPAVLRITVCASLIQGTTNRVLAQKEVTVEEPMPEETPYCGVIVANQAMAQVLQLIAKFVIENCRIKAASVEACHPYNRNDVTTQR